MEETREMLQNPVTVVFYRKAYRRTEAREPQDVSGQRTPKLCVPDRMNDSEGCRRVWCPSDEVKQRVFFFAIVAQRPRVSPPSRPGAVDGLLVPLAHCLMRTPCGEQKRHWYRIMDFATLTSGKAPSSTLAPSKAPCCSATLRRNSFR